MNLSMLFVRPYNNRFDLDGLIIIFAMEIAVLVDLSIIKDITNRSKRETTERYSAILDIIVLVGYFALVLSQTWFMNSRNYARRISLDLFWSYRYALKWESGLQIANTRILEQICLNIIMFIPMGYLLPELFDCFTQKPWKIIVAGCIVSALIEAGQFIMHVGLCELDDVFNNTLGCFVGLLLWRINTMVCEIVQGRQKQSPQ